MKGKVTLLRKKTSKYKKINHLSRKVEYLQKLIENILKNNSRY